MKLLALCLLNLKEDANSFLDRRDAPRFCDEYK